MSCMPSSLLTHLLSGLTWYIQLNSTESWEHLQGSCEYLPMTSLLAYLFMHSTVNF